MLTIDGIESFLEEVQVNPGFLGVDISTSFRGLAGELGKVEVKLLQNLRRSTGLDLGFRLGIDPAERLQFCCQRRQTSLTFLRVTSDAEEEIGNGIIHWAYPSSCRRA